jgi:hypothetical protein
MKPDNVKIKFGAVAFTERIMHIWLTIKDEGYAVQMSLSHKFLIVY